MTIQYIYLVNHKDGALDAFKIYKAKVKKQKERKIKITRLKRCEEYYGQYTEKRQMPCSFAKFLAEQGIVAQYTMPSTP